MMNKGRRKIQKAESMSKEEAIRTYITMDGVKFEIDYESFKRVSPLVKGLEPQAATFNKIDSQTFKYIIKYIDIRKENVQTRKIDSPLPATDLNIILDKPQVLFIQQIKGQGWAMYEKVLDAATFFEIDYLKQMLLAGFAMQIISKDKETLISQLGIKDVDPEQTEKMKDELRAIIKQIKK